MTAKKPLKKKEETTIKHANGKKVTISAAPNVFKDCSTCNGKGTVMEGHRICSACQGACVVKV